MERSLLAQGQRVRVVGFGFIVIRRAELDGGRVKDQSPRSFLPTVYCSDFGSERFFGDFLSRSATSSAAHAGLFTFPSRMMSLALTCFPYSFSFALPSERRVEPSSEIPANNPLLRE